MYASLKSDNIRIVLICNELDTNYYPGKYPLTATYIHQNEKRAYWPNRLYLYDLRIPYGPRAVPACTACYAA